VTPDKQLALSPLATVDPTSLDTLFLSDPMTLTDADILRTIGELRRRRSVFASEEAAASLKAKKAKTRAAPTTDEAAATNDKPASELSLDDLLGDTK
jgi:hypothetical protein